MLSSLSNTSYLLINQVQSICQLNSIKNILSNTYTSVHTVCLLRMGLDQNMKNNLFPFVKQLHVVSSCFISVRWKALSSFHVLCCQYIKCLLKKRLLTVSALSLFGDSPIPWGLLLPPPSSVGLTLFDTFMLNSQPKGRVVASSSLILI